MSRKPTGKTPRRSRTKASSRVRSDNDVDKDDEKPRRRKPAANPVSSKGRKQSRSEAVLAPTALQRRAASGTGDYEIGRGKPPREYSWKPGQSGNKTGRPKGSKNEKTIWKEIMRRKITLAIGGKPKTITLQEGIQYRIANDALSGNVKSANFVLNRLAGIITDIGEPHLAEDDQAVLNAYRRSIRQEFPDDADDD